MPRNKKTPAKPDATVNNQGSIFLLTPISKAAKEWTDSKLDPDAQMFGNAIVVEHRYISDIVQGMQNDGLTVQ